MTYAIVEVFFGSTLQSSGAVATDVSQYVDLIRGIDITRGAQNELSEIQPSTCSITLDNSDGRFTPERAASPYSPNVVMGVPIRVSVATFTPRTGSAPYPMDMLGDDFDDNRISSVLWPNSYGGASEVGGRARIPLTPGVTAGYQSVREWTLVASKLTAKLVTLPAAGGSSSAVCSMWVNSTTGGTRLGWRYNALTGVISAESQTSFFDGSAVNLTYSPFSHLWLRVRESGGNVFWESSSDGAAWTTRRTLAAPAWVTSQTHAVEFAGARTGGIADYCEWDFVGATVHPRFLGLVQDWPTEWKGLNSTASITCTDLLTWANIVKQLQPMLAQEVLLDRPSAYYPLTEASDSTSAGDLSGTQRVGALALVQAGAGGTLEFGAGSGPMGAGGATAPVFTPASSSAGKYLQADLGTGIEAANTNFRVRAEAWFSTSTNGRVLLGWMSSDASKRIVVSLESGTGKLQIEYSSFVGGPLTAFVVAASPNLADGNLHHLIFNENEQTVHVDGTSYAVTTGTTDGARTLQVGGFQNSRLWNGTIAHVALYVRSVTSASLTPHYTTGTTAHVGESASDRMARLASYAGLAVTTLGTAFDALASQAELGRSALEHMKDVARTESGKLLTNRSSGIPLVFQSRDLRYNPVASLTLDYADLETDGVRYAYDDQKMVNSVTASRPGGATQRVINQDSIDAYGEKPDDLALLKNTDNATADAANWVISRYSNPLSEIRQIPVEAYSMPVATYRALLDADVSTVIGLTSLPGQAPASTVTAIVEGYTEQIQLRQHSLNFHTSRANTDAVWVLDDATYSVLDSTTRLAY